MIELRQYRISQSVFAFRRRLLTYKTRSEANRAARALIKTLRAWQ